MSGQYNSVSDYLRSISEMWNGDDTSYYRSLNGQIMFPDPKAPLTAEPGGAEERSDLRQNPRH